MWQIEDVVERVTNLIVSLQELVSVKEDEDSEASASYKCVETVLTHIYQLGLKAQDIMEPYKRQVGSLLLTALPQLVIFAKRETSTPISEETYRRACHMRAGLEYLVEPFNQYRTFPVNVELPPPGMEEEEEKLDMFLTEQLQLLVNWEEYDDMFKKFEATALWS